MQTLGHHNRLLGLDGLRALSIALVMASHGAQSPGFWFPKYARSIESIGTFGVEVFFVISGFLITWLLLKEEKKQTINLKNFYLRRAFRILPAAIFFLGTIGLMKVVFEDIVSSTWFDIGTALGFVKNIFPGQDRETAHYWSLSIEEQFYLFWPLVLIKIQNERARLRSVFILIILAPIWRQLNIIWFGAETINWSRTDLRYDALLMGCFLALSFKDTYCSRFWQYISGKSLFVFFAAFGVLVLSFFPALLKGPGYIVFLFPTLRMAMVALVIASIVHQQSGLHARILNAPIVTWVGRLSYSLYLWQQLFCFTSRGSWDTTFPVNIVLSFGAAAICFYAVEQPMLRLREKWMNVT